MGSSQSRPRKERSPEVEYTASCQLSLSSAPTPTLNRENGPLSGLPPPAPPSSSSTAPPPPLRRGNRVRTAVTLWSQQSQPLSSPRPRRRRRRPVSPSVRAENRAQNLHQRREQHAREERERRWRRGVEKVAADAVPPSVVLRRFCRALLIEHDKPAALHWAYFETMQSMVLCLPGNTSRTILSIVSDSSIKEDSLVARLEVSANCFFGCDEGGQAELLALATERINRTFFMAIRRILPSLAAIMGVGFGGSARED